MTLKYSLSENDFLQHQLFTASKNKTIKKQRVRTWLLLVIGCLMLSYVLYPYNRFGSYYFLGFAVITLIFYPLYQKYQYKKHYQKFIIDNYRLRFDEICTVEFLDDKVEITSTSFETKINYSTFEKISETGEYFFLKLKTGGDLLVPKKGLDNLQDFRQILLTIKEKYSLEEITDLNWKWK